MGSGLVWSWAGDAVLAGTVGAGDAGLGAAGWARSARRELGGAVAGRALEVVAGFGAVSCGPGVRAAGPGRAVWHRGAAMEGVDERVVEVGARWPQAAGVLGVGGPWGWAVLPA